MAVVSRDQLLKIGALSKARCDTWRRLACSTHFIFKAELKARAAAQFGELRQLCRASYVREVTDASAGGPTGHECALGVFPEKVSRFFG